MRRCIGAIGALLLAAACSESGHSGSELADRGERVYYNVCSACHSPDPSQDGVLGPAIHGASRELLEARVLRGEYPAGYTPKRTTAVMPAFAYLEDEIPALEAYLAQAAAAK